MVCMRISQAFEVSRAQACHEFKSKYSFLYFVSLPLFSTGPPEASSSVMITTPNNISWSPSATGLKHRIIVCFEGTSNCPVEISCMGCNFAVISEITRTDDYNIRVCSSNVVDGEPCQSESCISTLAGMQK